MKFKPNDLSLAVNVAANFTERQGVALFSAESLEENGERRDTHLHIDLTAKGMFARITVRADLRGKPHEPFVAGLYPLGEVAAFLAKRPMLSPPRLWSLNANAEILGATAEDDAHYWQPEPGGPERWPKALKLPKRPTAQMRAELEVVLGEHVPRALEVTKADQAGISGALVSVLAAISAIRPGAVNVTYYEGKALVYAGAYENVAIRCEVPIITEGEKR